MGSIFGGSKSSSKNESGNKNMGLITNALTPQLDLVSQGGNAMSALLGGDMSGLNTFKQNAGYDWEAAQGNRSIAAGNLSKGLGDSGATLKALARFNAGLDNSYMDKYLSGQNNMAQLGLGVGNLLGNVGQYSKGKSTQTSGGGFGSFLGSAAGAIAASDRRVKQDIVKLREESDGLGVYEYSYVWAPSERVTGVMADEVRELRPWALGPKIGKYDTVDYGRL